MTKIHLDTCFLIRALVPGSAEDGALRGWLKERVRISVSAIAWAEFLCGPLTPQDRSAARRLLGSPVAFSEADADVAASLFNAGGRRRGTFLDCLIAAASMRDCAMLATANSTDFQPFVSSGLGVLSAPVSRVPVS